MIQLIDVKKTHRNNRKSKVEALKGINLELPSKGLVLLVGSNGSGKSTLLSILGGLDTVTSGKLIVDGQELSAFSQNQLDGWRARDVSFVFQNYNLLSDYTVAQNIKLGRMLSGGLCSDEQISSILKLVRLEGFEDRYPKDLSGGERQKVAVARALIKNPKVVFVDEPTTQTDEESTDALLKLFKQVSRELLVVFISHDTTRTLKLADRLVELKGGLIVRDEVLATPKKTSKAEKDTSEDGRVISKASFSQAGIAFDLGVKNFLQRPFRTAAAVMITLFALVLFSSTIMLAGYNRWEILAKDAMASKIDYYVFCGDDISLQVQTDLENLISKQMFPYYSYNFNPQISGGILEAPHSFGQTQVLFTDYLQSQLLLTGAWEGFTLAPVTLTGFEALESTSEWEHIRNNYLLVVQVAPGFMAHEFSNSSMTVTKLFLPASDITAAELENIVKAVEGHSDVRLESVKSSAINSFSDNVALFEITFLVMSLFSLAIAAMFLYNFVSNVISDKRKDIGILRSMGAKASTIFCIFMLAVGLVSAITFVLSVGLSFVVMAALNAMASNFLGWAISAISVSFVNVLVVFSVCAAVTFAATFLPIYRYSKQSPALQIKK